MPNYLSVGLSGVIMFRLTAVVSSISLSKKETNQYCLCA